MNRRCVDVYIIHTNRIPLNHQPNSREYQYKNVMAIFCLLIHSLCCAKCIVKPLSHTGFCHVLPYGLQ